MELLQLGTRRSNASEDYSSKSVEPKSPEREGNTEPSPRNVGGRRRDWMASIHVDEGTVRLSSKGESDHNPKVGASNPPPATNERHCRNAVTFAFIRGELGSAGP